MKLRNSNRLFFIKLVWNKEGNVTRKINSKYYGIIRGNYEPMKHEFALSYKRTLDGKINFDINLEHHEFFHFLEYYVNRSLFNIFALDNDLNILRPTARSYESVDEYFADLGMFYMRADDAGFLDEFRKLFPDNSVGFDKFFKTGNYIIVGVVLGGETMYHLIEIDPIDEVLE